MRLILIRHGETEHNRRRLTLGRFDAPLNERGRAQAAAVAASFHTAPSALYTSPLSRARETAEAIAANTGVPVREEAALIEMDVGEMEHLTGAELLERYPEFLRVWTSREAAEARMPGAEAVTDASEARMPGGETLREVQERAWAAVQSWRAAEPDGEVVAVTHNFVIGALVCRAIGLPLADFRRIKHEVASRTMLDIGDQHGTLLVLNDQSHLTAAGLGGGPR
jgi:broad specificity phosphatase PhoE